MGGTKSKAFDRIDNVDQDLLIQNNRVSRTGGSGWDLSTGKLVGAVLKVVRHRDHLCFYLLFF